MKHTLPFILTITVLFSFLFISCSPDPSVETGGGVENPYAKAILNTPAFADYDVTATPDKLVKCDDAVVVLAAVKEVFSSISDGADIAQCDDLLQASALMQKGESCWVYRFKTEQMLAGNGISEEFAVPVSWLKTASPDLKIGDRLILILKEAEDDVYCFAHPLQPFLYVSEEGRIYPCGDLDSYLPYTGMTVDMFKDAINQ